MAITLEAARAAARQRRWHAVLGLAPGASADEVRKARRRLQLTAHTDKGGSKELSQLLNQAADELLEQCPRAWVPQAWVPQAKASDPEWLREFLREVNEEIEQRRRRQEEEARAATLREEAARRRWEQEAQRAATLREEAARRREEAEKQRFEEERRRQEDHDRWWLEFDRLQRDRAHEDTVRRVGHRRTRCQRQAYLGELAGRAFPVIKCRLRELQGAGKHRRAAALAYAVEAEMGARRVARETRFPKTEALAKRDAHKAARLDRLRPAFQKAYDRLRYVRRTGRPEDFARLCVQRLLAQAWDVLLEMPAPLEGGDTIILADW